MRKLLGGHADLATAIGRSGWLLSERLLRALLELTIGLWVARYLGPVLFGDYSYALSLVMLAGPLVHLGLQGILVRELVREPERSGEILGTAAALRVLAASVVVPAVLAATLLAGSGSSPRLSLVRILSLGLGLSFVEVMESWLQSRQELRNAAAARSLAALVASGLRVVLIVRAASVQAFAWVAVLETGLWGLALFAAYSLTKGGQARWSVSLLRARGLLSESWPLVLSGLGVLLNLRIDQVMLGRLAGSQEVGWYAGAVRFSEALYMVPNILSVAVFPLLVRLRSDRDESYPRQMQSFFDLMVIASTILAAALTVGSKPLVSWILGSPFSDSVPILRIHVWAALFVFCGGALSRWLINEGLVRFSLLRHGLGAVVNVACNLYLIPRFGGVGAAWATVLSYAVAHYGACFLTPRTRPAAAMISRAFLVPVRAASSLLKR